MSNFITAYSKRTGKKVRVPAHFFDVPSLSRDLSKTPRQNKADERKPRPEPKASEPVASSDSAPAEASTTPVAGDQDKE